MSLAGALATPKLLGRAAALAAVLLFAGTSRGISSLSSDGLAIADLWRGPQTPDFAALAGLDRFRGVPSSERPVIRWIKGLGNDDNVTRTALGSATRLFGDEVDYVLLTVPGFPEDRAKYVMAAATRQVVWRPVSPEDNPVLARRLNVAGCLEGKYGYWWKWFPERLKPNAPEMILDGDMVITARPDWFEDWKAGRDPVRVSQDDRSGIDRMYGKYSKLTNSTQRLYSGLVSLPPGFRYMDLMENVFEKQSLTWPHDGTRDMDEQGVIACTFNQINPGIIPLYEFPFCRAFENFTDYGVRGDQGKAWGYHFGNAFRRHNPHFARMQNEGKVSIYE